MGNAVALAIQAVSFLAVQRSHQTAWAEIAIAVLGIARVDIALPAVGIVKVEDLLRVYFPGE
ncbi:hypothetical protein D3C80_1597840 [compost metagenome]